MKLDWEDEGIADVTIVFAPTERDGVKTTLKAKVTQEHESPDYEYRPDFGRYARTGPARHRFILDAVPADDGTVYTTVTEPGLITKGAMALRTKKDGDLFVGDGAATERALKLRAKAEAVLRSVGALDSGKSTC